jgi:hypothetical protein
MTDKPTRVVGKQENPILERRGGYRGGSDASQVPSPPEVPSGSVLQPEAPTAFALQPPVQQSSDHSGNSSDTAG